MLIIFMNGNFLMQLVLDQSPTTDWLLSILLFNHPLAAHEIEVVKPSVHAQLAKSISPDV